MMHSLGDPYLDIATWERRDAFEFFRGFDKPYFNVCVRLDVAPLKRALSGVDGGITLACYFIALRLANAQRPFRLRLEGGRVRGHDMVHGSTTVLRKDGESFHFAYLELAKDFKTFVVMARERVREARNADARFEPRPDEQALIHFTSLPWMHFTSFSHARNWGREDSIPKLAFGRIDVDGARHWMPFAVEVHHALMDGVHVGRFVQAFEDALREPSRLI